MENQNPNKNWSKNPTKITRASQRTQECFIKFSADLDMIWPMNQKRQTRWTVSDGRSVVTASLRPPSKQISKPNQMSSKNYEILTGASQHDVEYLHKFWAQLVKVWSTKRKEFDGEQWLSGFETAPVQNRNWTKTQIKWTPTFPKLWGRLIEFVRRLSQKETHKKESPFLMDFNRPKRWRLEA